MIWMTWRQHRNEALVAGLLVAAFAALVLSTGLPALDAFSDRGLDACHGRPAPDDECAPLVDRFQSEFGHPNSWYAEVGMTLLPLLLGMFIGAPLLAREFEHGTWQLAWSQAVPRLRWLVVKLALVLAAVAVVAAAVSGLWMWWHQPHVRFRTRMDASYFSYALPVFVACTMFAVAIGATAGRLIRRTLPAMAVVLLVYFGVRVPFEAIVHDKLQEPATAVVPYGEAYTEADEQGHYVISRHVVDRNGNPVSDSVLQEIEAQAGPNTNTGRAPGAAQGGTGDEYIQQGLREEVMYHPSSSFWRLQLTEAGIFLGISAALFTLLLWLVRRRAV
jgi:hypothetical protein